MRNVDGVRTNTKFGVWGEKPSKNSFNYKHTHTKNPTNEGSLSLEDAQGT